MRRIASLLLLSSLSQGGKYQLSQNLQCPFGFDLVGKQCEKPVYLPAATTCLVGDLVGSNCISKTSTILQCPLGTTVVGNSCVVKNSLPAQINCPSGYNLEGNMCVSRKTLELVDQCYAGRPDGKGNCIVTDRIARLRRLVCPAGYVEDEDTCVKVSEFDCSPAEYIASDLAQTVVGVSHPVHLAVSHGHGGHSGMADSRYLNKKHATYIPLKVTQPTAVVQQTVIEAPEVPASSVTVIQQTCRRKDYVNFVEESSCATGYVEEGEFCISISIVPSVKRCSNGGMADDCVAVDKTLPNYVCYEGDLMGSECVFTTLIEKERVCPAGTYMEGSECIHATKSQVICPPGTVSDGFQCVGKEMADPIGTIETPCVGKECFSNF